MRPLAVTVLMDLPPGARYHTATIAALRHASEHAAIPIEIRVVQTDRIGDVDRLALDHAVVVGPGSPYRDPEAVHAAIRVARERGVPLVGT
jgi:CTP synthase (UTP-ammonia lyase)